MAKASLDDKRQYSKKINPYEENIKRLLNREEQILTDIKNDNKGASFKRLELVDDMLNLASNYIVLNSVSQFMINLRNEVALNEARKTLYKAVLYLEEVVSNFVDAPFSDYEDKLAEIASLDAGRRYLLVRKLGLSIQLLKNAYGDNSKWRWAFVELEGRCAAGTKNIFDIKNAVSLTDPRSPHYEPAVRHLRLAKKLLMQAADRYREKYELSTNHSDDFKMGILFLNALKRLLIVLGDHDVETVRKKEEAWSVKLEADIKKVKEAANKVAAKNG
jgi:hypothetical protein